MYKSKFNKHLEQFKGIHRGKSAIIFATGPTVNDYKPFEGSKSALRFGLNRIYKQPHILESLDYYYFGSHYYLDSEHRKNIDHIHKHYEFTKLASSYEEGRSHAEIGRGNISPEDARKLGAIPFENNLSHFTNDPAKYCTLGHSIVFPPLQHILYMGIEKIYLVGCDGGFTAGLNSGDAHLLHWWYQFKIFRDEKHPDIKIISVNPVGLKGMFEEDLYV